jgi:DNA replication protein DnaC
MAMDNLDFVRCQALNNVPHRKVQLTLDAVSNGDASLDDKSVKMTAINRYAESNIPIEYWTLKMERDFKGSPLLLTTYQDYVKDLATTYANGICLCLAGSHGTGKTMMATSILKRATYKHYACLYTQMSNMVSALTNYNNQEDVIRELCMVDFLVIDELDPRFFSSEASNQLYARSFENVFRTRTQNMLPTIICTNSPNLVESFAGTLKQSIGSLFANKIHMISILDEDFRKAK